MKKVLLTSMLFFLTSICVYSLPTDSDVTFITEGSFSFNPNKSLTSKVIWSVPSGKWCVESVVITTQTGTVSLYTKSSGVATIEWKTPGKHEVLINVIYKKDTGETVPINRNPKVIIVSLVDLKTDGGGEILSSGPDSKTYAYYKEKDKKATVIAYIDPIVAEGQLPSDWSYTGLTGPSLIYRDASLDTAIDYDVVVKCGVVEKNVKLRVYESKKGNDPKGTILFGGDAYVGADDLWHLPKKGKLVLFGTDETDTDDLVFADGSVYKTINDSFSDHVWFYDKFGQYLALGRDTFWQERSGNDDTYEVTIIYAARDGREPKTVLDKYLAVGLSYGNFSQLNSRKIIVGPYAKVSSISLTDSEDPGRKSNNVLEVVGSQDVDLKALKTAYIWQIGYPKWTISGVGGNQIGEDIVQNFSNAPIIGNPNILGGSKKYDVSVKGNYADQGQKGIVNVYPSGKASSSFDFGKYGEKVKKTLESIPAFGKEIKNIVKFPNGVVDFENEWVELTNDPKVIWAFDFNAGLDPLIGYDGEIPLIGVPEPVTKFVGAKAGLFLTVGGSLSLDGHVFRDKDNPNGNGKAVLSGEITMGLKVEGVLPVGGIGFEVQISAGVSGDGTVTYDGAQNALVFTSKFETNGIKLKVGVNYGEFIEFGEEWELLEPTVIYETPNPIVITKAP